MGIDLKTFTMQIIDSDPEGIKLCRIQGSTMVTVVVPREKLPRLKELPDIPTRGLYYLLQAGGGCLQRVYAGKTTNGIQRLDGHNSQKNWWNVAVMFLMPENELSTDVVDGLEATAIKYISVRDGYTIDNSTTPSPYVNPYNENYIEQLHRDVLFRMKVLGYDLDQAKIDRPAHTASDIFHTVKRGVQGLGRYVASDGSFEVLVGSEVDVSTRITNNGGVDKIRRELLNSGAIVQEGGVYLLREPCLFETPSAAAVFVLGGSQNGWTEWVDAEGNTLDEVYRKGGGEL